MENEASNFTTAEDVRETSSFKFLEAEVIVDRHRIHLKHFNKNKEFVLQSKKQKFFRYHHIDSFNPRSQKVGTIIESVIRMSRYSTNVSDLLDSIKLTYAELQTLDYTPRLFADALTKIIRNRSDEPGTWSFLTTYIESLRDSSQQRGRHPPAEG